MMVRPGAGCPVPSLPEDRSHVSHSTRVTLMYNVSLAQVPAHPGGAGHVRRQLLGYRHHVLLSHPHCRDLAALTGVSCYRFSAILLIPNP